MTVLKKAYKKDPTVAVRGLESMLNKLDTLDSRRKDATDALLKVAESKEEERIRELKARLRKYDEEYKKLVAAEQRFRELELIEKAEAKR